MASNNSYRFISALLLLYLATTALFLLFIQHSSSSADERPASQLWALLALDPPVAARRRAPELRRYDRVFNWTVSYRRDSDVPLTYGRVVSRPSRREHYVRELRRHMDVDVLGPCANVSCGSAAQCFARFRGNYTFYLALEAAHCVDFVSSPLHQALRHGMVPVVRGAADYRRLAPPHSFIDAAAFSGPEALARHLTGLSDDQLSAYRRWQGTHEVLPADWACEVCTRLHRLGANSSAFPAHGGEQLHRWWYERGRCEPAPAGDATAPAS
ncbi:glycoprotein 3-alpha-L-fucosyltransferase A-like [Pollicipes pollicipes]|uniref:glycoprotein 3-alpha-L-fucosyltransferase A-like n=1 Tax=Pollicipes pollicipes TaxID=41117 RepID=UPI001884BD2A|nr:glycoprotein 3-alpha-L-fucosyltransferase A-like [Pollicipes pollicipes]